MRLSALMLSAVFAASLSPAASAQNIPEVLGDIFGGGQSQNRVENIYIENVPVSVTYDTRFAPIEPGSMLIITAVAPPAPNVRRASPLVMGETRILLSRLSPPIQMVVAVPSDMAREVDYAQISGRIENSRGDITHEEIQVGSFDGGQPAYIELQALNVSAAPYNPPYEPVPVTPTYNSSFSGHVTLSDLAPLQRGAILVVRVFDEILAGGTGGDMIAEERVALDGRAAPYTFALALPNTDNGRLNAPSAEIFIEDWAGRKIYNLPSNIGLTQTTDGSLLPVNVQLNRYQGSQSSVPYTPQTGVMRNITGRASFNANRGLPRGATLNVRLIDPASPRSAISRTSVPLDGLSGDVDYTLSVDRAVISARNDYYLDADIKDAEGRALFVTRSGRVLTDGPANITLEALPNY
ncbi:YbaY family lipoprotein [Robiginitomaculum antarcticum]|uniref:YbaY family lipoprotein n=1 Tax=Robiginitomaculum antarcticum TaxID=437507 RepID=UPI0003A46872|nr:YbaY family lipoprotein [Robiginitomaculum antarcticum]